MQVLAGTKRDITIMEWQEILDKYMKRANDSMECFRRFRDPSDLEHLIEDCEKILENAKQAKRAIECMDLLGIR